MRRTLRQTLLLAALAALPASALAATTVSVSGPGGSASQTLPGASGTFSIRTPLARNAVNSLTVTATDDAGNRVSQDVRITQLSLDSVVVSRVEATPLPPERVIQLVNDGVIDLEDPANFNVSTFSIVLTIGQREIPIDIPVAVGVQEPSGYEVYQIPNDPGGGGRTPQPRNVEVVVFNQVVPCDSCVEPPRIPGVIVIDGAIRSLKEFYSVRLLLMNMSGLFTLEDVAASLEFPDGGLTATLPDDGVAAFDSIGPGDGLVPGQREREFIVRGDEIGTRRIRVHFGGTVTGPGIEADDPIPFNGSAETSVQVKGPPAFRVRVSHPARVVARVPYELGVEITNTGDAAALYASLELDIGADANFAECSLPEGATNPVCEDVDGPLVRNLRHLFPGDVVTEKFTVIPHVSGDISSCVGVSDQNVTLEVLVGRIGCIVGQYPPPLAEASGAPTVTVAPFANAQGIGTDSPVTAFFSELVQEGSITQGPSGSFQVFDEAGVLQPGLLRRIELRGRTIAIWQHATGHLEGNSEYTVVLTDAITDLEGNKLFNPWQSTFKTTSSTEDLDAPTLTLSIEPGVDAAQVLPGQIVRVNAYAADQGSGVARVELRSRDTDAAGALPQLVDQKSVFDQAEQGPCIFAIDSSQLVPGHSYELLGTAYDVVGNARDATLHLVLASSAAPPTIALPADPADDLLYGISLALAPEATSSAVRQVRYYLDGAPSPFATLFVAPFRTSLPTLGLALGEHVIRAVAEDGLGQTGEDELRFRLAENPNEPIVRFAGASDGASFVTGTLFTVLGSAEDPLGIEALRLALDDPAGPPLGDALGAVTIDTSTLEPGAHRLYAIATNLAGNANDPANPDSYLEFSVRTPPNGAPPPAPQLTSAAVSAPGLVRVEGTATPLAQVELRNASEGIAVTVTVGADGRFTAGIDGAPGDTIEAVVFDLETSQQPSEVASLVVPVPRILTGIEVAPSQVTLVARNATQDLTVTGRYAGGGSEVLTAQATFSSSAASVASASGAGRVVANARGEAVVTARFGGFEASCEVAVEIRTLESISVEPAAVTLPAIGATQALAVIGHFSDATSETLTSGLSFSSSQPARIGVTGGVVRALAAGSAIVTVSVSGLPPVQVTVTVDTGLDEPPSVAFLAPAAGSAFERGESVAVTARASDAIGVARVTLTASGAASFSETRQVTPPATSTDQGFTFAIPADAPIGGAVVLTLQAEDTGGNLSTLAARAIDVVDRTDPVVEIQAPAIDAAVGYADTVQVVVAASDAVGVAEIRYQVDGISASGAETIAPPLAAAGASFEFTVPVGLVASELVIRAFARDAAGNEGASAPVPIAITDADRTPPASVALAASAPSGAVTTVSYEVTDGLADLDHVELYFRRDGLGTFSRYTGPLGDGDGAFTPQGGASGTIAFDATRMGGDGDYEFFTVGVDRAGNREAPPEDAGEIAGDPGVATTIATGAPVTVLTTDTELADDSLAGQNVRVDGATLTLVGAPALGNVELVNGAVLTHREATQSEAFGIELTAWTLSVDASSRIDATARGHLGGNRSGLGETAHTSGFAAGAGPGSGGSYGGLGGDYAGNGASVPNPVYGNVANPVDLGSGGGAWSGAGGDGGGRVLVGAINLVLDGTVVANGGLSAGSASGEGSGGSINLTLRTLSGRGGIAADGGTTNGGNHTGGGGGRIAVRSLDRATYDLALVTARGGDGFYGDGADGTIFLLGEGESGGELVINGLGAGSPFTDLILPPGQSFDSITLQNGANVIAQGPIVLDGALRLRGGSRLAHPAASEAGLSVTAREVIVESGSAIDATGRGYLAGNRSGLGETAHTLGFAPGAQAGSGGSHGGIGGDYTGNGGSVPNSVYGDPKRPSRLGAGGGAWSGAGGDGGGFLRIVASDRLVVEGALRADGGLSSGSASGEGAGGSLWIETARLAGTGTISADGGTANGANHTGGGGGRVAIYAEFVDPNADLAGLRNVTARGGDGFYGDGAAGTVFLHLPGDTDGTLFVDGVMPEGQTHPVATALPPIGPGVAVSVTADSLGVDGTLRAFTPNALVGLRLDPDLAQGESFEIASNTADTITVVTPNERGVEFSSVAAAGRSYAGSWHFDDVVFRRGGFLELADPLAVADELALAENALLAHLETTAVYAGDLAIDADTLTIDATSRLDVTGRGYLGGGRAGLGDTAHGVGFAPGAQPGSGGSHGGLGGDYGGNGASVPNPAYGNPTEPRDLGAGGGAWSGAGADGGGRVQIVARALVVDGALRADGATSFGSASGEGAGGSLDLRVDTLSGSGVISASGGSFANSNHTGGGGGRIAIRHGGTLDFPLERVLAVGGDGFYGDGGHGTVFLLAPGGTYGDLVIDGHGFAQPADSVEIPAGLVVDNLSLRNGVRAVADSLVSVRDTLRIQAGATLSHTRTRELGLQIDTRRLVIESNGAIEVSGRGYLGGNKTGLGETAHTLGFTAGAQNGTGGSHGGSGGDYASNGASVTNPLYGDPKRPTRLGAGGGAWSGAGGDGGGAVHVVASESVVVDGAIRADGALSSGSASGEGAGGSVWIETAAIGGAGTISANGGTLANANHTGGGGGRVAILASEVDPAADLAGLRSVTAYGGDGFYGDGAPGTVFWSLAGAADGTLVFDAGRASGTWPPAAGLPPIGPGLAATVIGDSLTVDGKLRAFTPNGLVGLRLVPDTTQQESFEIVASSVDAITLATPNENGVAFASVAAVGARYAAGWRFDEVVLQGGASVELFDPIAVSGALDLTERSRLAHPETATVYEPGLEIDAGTLAIDATSAIDVSGRGYLGGNKTGLGETAHTLGFAPGAQNGTGGSYGGLGGDYSGNGPSVPNLVYGDASDPFELGSGGGAWGGAGGDGGGRVRIDADALVLDGAIRADGGLSSGSASGEGSGGALDLRIGSVSGAGAISANGGGTGGATHTGGGGGRVAIRYQSGPSPLPNPISASGGDGSFGDGQAGSVLIEGP